MKDIQQKIQTSIIFITHDLGVVANVADRVAVMYGGRIIEIGTADEIFYNPQHPYTWGLLSSMPTLETSEEKLYAIPGSPPDGCHRTGSESRRWCPAGTYPDPRSWTAIP
ncbi:MAG: oligopeptide/dipeptide ABC transporter ATP-binding protein [Candidatus Cryptobacteroides sp.]|nr:oligopeptide/dipeptide ABC transporter ATP-binding protein [Candidatus Cryptobacteroides sp.]